mmetsp:Transcript_3427/g.6342  ORF Transcript_3427/g.6342 Transcript_3427/m.6342 type:complete len:373 (-) Transcript_3427:39-1157(-)
MLTSSLGKNYVCRFSVFFISLAINGHENTHVRCLSLNRDVPKASIYKKIDVPALDRILSQRESVSLDRSEALRIGSNILFNSGLSASLALALISSDPRPSAAAEKTGGNRSILSRFDTDALYLPPPTRSSEFSGIDNTYYSDWIAGTWDVRQTLVSSSAPLGLRFVGGPSGSVQIGEKTMAEQERQVGVPVRLRLRFVRTKFGTAEDRVFNTQERLNGFAGRTVVASAGYADVGGSNRASVLAMGGSEDDPLQTTLVYFKGPAAQKTFLVAHGSDPVGEVERSGGPRRWVGYEVTRQIFALTNANTAPPITTDTEALWSFEQLGENRVRGKLRLAEYLNAQSDQLYFEAKNRAVSIADYELDMRRVSDDSKT